VSPEIDRHRASSIIFALLATIRAVVERKDAAGPQADNSGGKIRDPQAA
jgi:hypothetical protein